MNASDNRNAEDVDKVLGGMAGNCAITSFFAPKATPGSVPASGAKRKKKLVLIMDEVDGMSSGDQGGIQVCSLRVLFVFSSCSLLVLFLFSSCSPTNEQQVLFTCFGVETFNDSV